MVEFPRYDVESTGTILTGLQGQGNDRLVSRRAARIALERPGFQREARGDQLSDCRHFVEVYVDSAEPARHLDTKPWRPVVATDSSDKTTGLPHIARGQTGSHPGHSRLRREGQLQT